MYVYKHIFLCNLQHYITKGISLLYLVLDCVIRENVSGNKGTRTNDTLCEKMVALARQMLSPILLRHGWNQPKSSTIGKRLKAVQISSKTAHAEWTSSSLCPEIELQTARLACRFSKPTTSSGFRFRLEAGANPISQTGRERNTISLPHGMECGISNKPHTFSTRLKQSSSSVRKPADDSRGTASSA